MWSPDGKYITLSRTAIEWHVSRHRVVLLSSRQSILKSACRRATTVAWFMLNPHWFGFPGSLRVKLAHAGGKVVSQDRILVSAPEEMIRHNSHPTNINWSFSLGGQVPMKYGEVMPTAATRCSSHPSIIRASGALHAGRLTVSSLLSIATLTIYLVDSEGRNLHALTSGNYANVVPSWSRDGKEFTLPLTALATTRYGGANFQAERRRR